MKRILLSKFDKRIGKSPGGKMWKKWDKSVKNSNERVVAGDLIMYHEAIVQ